MRRIVGWVFVLVMAGSPMSIHTICQISGFSAIYLTLIFTLATLPYGVIAMRRGQITRHRVTMIPLYALVLTRLFTPLPLPLPLPGRLPGAVLLGLPYHAQTCM
ncbi:MAG: hypothetical protein Q4G22_15095 [Paracoccus sp. (in: a-proteobacteria)]|uniref:hypothetical protein n=1 Tax=Paracoccus sp. TaxID=267 RepID=UPI0026E0B60E|nr:hypothetical protein [Paracoccus sp. (in: a-proteobacteria)]MDO5633140.1 hypothetical protein [Paracoccus sp. (in: a-proteobacteria)]